MYIKSQLPKPSTSRINPSHQPQPQTTSTYKTHSSRHLPRTPSPHPTTPHHPTKPTMKFPTLLLVISSLSLPLTLAAPTPSPQSSAPCISQSSNGVTTQSGDCGGNQQATSFSSNGGSGGAGNVQAGTGGGTVQAGTGGNIPDLSGLGNEIEQVASGGGGGGGALGGLSGLGEKIRGSISSLGGGGGVGQGQEASQEASG
ncbi:hypothetical protein ACLMJK_000011 [Lecanora helva]